MYESETQAAESHDTFIVQNEGNNYILVTQHLLNWSRM